MRVLVVEDHKRLAEALAAGLRDEGMAAGIGRHEPADLAKVVTACLESAGPEAGRRGLRVETSLGPAPLLGEPDLITRLVANLVDSFPASGAAVAQREPHAVEAGADVLGL
jgi:signal transduction histidine kinase